MNVIKLKQLKKEKKESRGENKMKFKEFFHKVFSSLSRKSNEKFYKKQKDHKHKFCVYDYQSHGEATKEFNFVHYFIKYKFVVPFLWFIKFIMGKRLDRGIPEQKHYNNVRIFNEAYDDTITTWVTEHLADPEYKDYDIQVSRLMNSDSVDLLRTMKKMMLLIVTQDTAYLEFLNILMHKIAHGMYEEYKGQTHHHLFYSRSYVYDVSYARMFSKLAKKDKEDAEKKTIRSNLRKK